MLAQIRIIERGVANGVELSRVGTAVGGARGYGDLASREVGRVRIWLGIERRLGGSGDRGAELVGASRPSEVAEDCSGPRRTHEAMSAVAWPQTMARRMWGGRSGLMRSRVRRGWDRPAKWARGAWASG